MPGTAHVVSRIYNRARVRIRPNTGHTVRIVRMPDKKYILRPSAFPRGAMRHGAPHHAAHSYPTTTPKKLNVARCAAKLTVGSEVNLRSFDLT